MDCQEKKKAPLGAFYTMSWSTKL